MGRGFLSLPPTPNRPTNAFSCSHAYARTHAHIPAGRVSGSPAARQPDCGGAFLPGLLPSPLPFRASQTLFHSVKFRRGSCSDVILPQLSSSLSLSLLSHLSPSWPARARARVRAPAQRPESAWEGSALQRLSGPPSSPNPPPPHLSRLARLCVPSQPFCAPQPDARCLVPGTWKQEAGNRK